MTRLHALAFSPLVVLLACGDAPNPCAGDGYLGYMGTIPTSQGCRDCETDRECQRVYGKAVPEGCIAVCGEFECMRHCPGECDEIPEAGCTPGTLACMTTSPPWYEYVYVCDPECEPSGGCRKCATDAECEVELGEGAVCVDHCGICCVPGESCYCV